jgi:hypothetical protein
MFSKFWSEIKNLNLGEKLLLALVFSLPFERLPSSEVSGLTIKLSLIIGAFLIVSNLKNIVHNVRTLRKIYLAPFALLCYSALSILWAENLEFWLKSNLTLGFCIILFYAVVSTVSSLTNREKLINLTLQVLLISSAVVIGFGFFQWTGDLIGLSANLTQIRPEYTADKLGLTRMHSVLLEPLYFGLFLLLPLSVLWADKKNGLTKNLYFRFAGLSVIYLAILLSLARGAIVASALIGVLGLVYNFKQLNQDLNPRVLLRIVGAGAFALVVLVAGTSLLGKDGTDEDHDYGKGFSTIIGHLETIKPWGNKDDEQDANSINSRDEARSQAWGIITESKSNLILGVGAGQYGLNLDNQEGAEATSNFVLLDIWAEYGLIGLLMLVIFLAFTIKDILITKKAKLSSFELILLVSIGIYLIGFAIQSITFGELAITHLWLALGLACGVIAGLRKSEKFN